MTTKFQFPFGLDLSTTTQVNPPDRREYLNAQGRIDNARFIDPNTKDYALSSNGHFQGMDAIPQQVYLALLTTLNLSSLAGFGNPMYKIKVVTPNIITQCTQAVQLALSGLINSGNISVKSVGVKLNAQGYVIVGVTYTNNVTYQTLNTNIIVS